MSPDNLRRQPIHFDNEPEPYCVRELYLDEHELITEGDIAKLLHRVVTRPGGEPAFESVEDAKRCPLRLANELCEVIASLSDLDGAGEEGKD